MQRITGILPALFTAYDGEGHVNLSVMRELVEWHLTHGVSGFYVLGSTGEGLLLSESERCRVAEAIVDQVRGRVPVIVHVGALTTRTACELATHAQRIGADAVSAVPPLFYEVGPEGIQEHYRQIGAASHLPVYLYHVPGRTPGSLDIDTLLSLIRTVPTVAGMKYTSYDLFTMRKIVDLTEGRLNVLSGPDEMMVASLAMGADGAIGTTQNLLPRLFRETYEAFRAGRVGEAQALQARINHVVDLFLRFGGLPAAKEIMRWLGFDVGGVRAPLMALNDRRRTELREALEALDFFRWADHR